MEILNFKKLYSKFFQDLNSWAQERILGLFVFNILIMLMIVLRSAGYFDPFFPLTVNSIVLLSLILSIALLRIRNRGIFLVALTFWILASSLKIFKIDVWAERTAVYTFQAFVAGVFLFIIETVFSKDKNNEKTG